MTFENCLKEAQELIYTNPRNTFVPAIDDLADETIESVWWKVRIELDMADEQEITTHYMTKRKAQRFLDKWKIFQNKVSIVVDILKRVIYTMSELREGDINE